MLGLLPRLIPACAGKTASGSERRSQSRAHPRVCGENVSLSRLRVLVMGSSPRVRGKHLSPARESVQRGLIPACAGKTYPKPDANRPTRAHPRVCGENTRRSAHQTVKGGSSPRVRGKRGIVQAARIVPGLIPACAGKTVARHGETYCTRAHPRVCGENATAIETKTRELGSSPRVRGKRWLKHPLRCRGRLIPACAGKTITG